MRKHHYIFIMLSVCLNISLGLAQTSGKTALVHRQVLSWGNADITKTTDGMNVRFILHQQREHLLLDSSSLSTKVPYYSCFVQIPAGRIVAIQIQKYTSHRIATGNLNSTTLSTLLKLAKSESTPLVQLQGYHWFRGRRLAQLNISAYTNNAQSIRAIDTVEVDLQYKMSSTYRNPTVLLEKTNNSNQFSIHLF